MKQALKLLLLMLLLTCMAVCMTSCRESLVIAQIIHNQQAEEIDENMQVAMNDEDNEEEDEDLPQQKITEATRNADTQKQADTRDDQPNAGAAPRAIHSDDSSKDNKADKSGSNKGKDKGKTKTATQAPGDGGGGGGDNGGQGGEREIYDDDGHVVKLPKDVNSVIAAGDAGIIVQMLGGRGILAGTSANVTGSGLAQAVFADEKFSEAQAYWDGNGTSPMSSANFKVLLANKPDVCTGTAGCFSDKQLAKLKKAGIAYVALPALDSPEHIVKAVSILGKMIGDRSGKTGGVNAKALARNYENYCNDLLADVSNAVGDSAGHCFSLYIVGWDENATFSIPGAGVSESGVAWTSSGGRPVSAFMQIGGVTDNTMSYQMSPATGYAVIPLNVNVEDNVSVTDGLSMLRKTDNSSFASTGTYYLGETPFKWVITDSNFTRDCIEYSKSSGGIWASFGRVTLTQGGTTISDWGFVSNNRIVRTNIRGDYRIVVNPYGVSSWADGSPESVLESIWTAYQVAGVFSEEDVRSEIRNFYRTFYRHELTNAQVTEILAGRP